LFAPPLAMCYPISWSLRVKGLAPRVSSIHQNQTRAFRVFDAFAVSVGETHGNMVLRGKCWWSLTTTFNRQLLSKTGEINILLTHMHVLLT
jgi:hypothetical protein